MFLPEGPQRVLCFTRQRASPRALPAFSPYASPASCARVAARRASQSAAAQVANGVQAIAPYTHHSGLDSTIGVSGKSTNLCGATTYTPFATWAAHTIRCRSPLCGGLNRVRRSFKALATPPTGALQCEGWGRWGPVNKNTCWRCEPLSFAYFSLRRQRKVGAAPHRGNASRPNA